MGQLAPLVPAVLPQWKGDNLLERFVPLKRLKEIDEACRKPLSACLEALYRNQCDLD
jgi:hypothetical protein